MTAPKPKAAPKTTAKPVAKPAAKPIETKVTKPVAEKPTAKPVVKAPAKSTAKAKPAAKPTTKPVAKAKAPAKAIAVKEVATPVLPCVTAETDVCTDKGFARVDSIIERTPTIVTTVNQEPTLAATVDYATVKASLAASQPKPFSQFTEAKSVPEFALKDDSTPPSKMLSVGDLFAQMKQAAKSFFTK